MTNIKNAGPGPRCIRLDDPGWEAVADILKKDGYTVAVVQHPETSYAEDIKYTKAVIDRQSGPVVLVGHSYGGAVITEAGNHPKVALLSTSPHSRWTLGKAAPRSSKACRRPPKGSSLPTMATSTLIRQPLPCRFRSGRSGG